MNKSHRIFRRVWLVCWGLLLLFFVSPLSAGTRKARKKEKFPVHREERSRGSREAREGNKKAEEIAAGKRFAPSEEVVAKAEEICPRLLALRRHVDAQYAEYESLALALGRHAANRSERELPGVARQLRKDMERLSDGFHNMVEPLNEKLGKMKEKEKRLYKRIDRAEQHGKAKPEDVRKADELNGEIQALQDKISVIVATGKPSYRIEDPKTMLLMSIIKVDKRQKGRLAAFMRNNPKLVDDRIILAHLDAEMKTLDETEARDGKDAKAESVRVKKERRRKSAAGKFRALFLDVRKKEVAGIRKLQAEIDRLAPKAARSRERGRKGGRTQKQFARLQEKMEAARQELDLLDSFVKGTDVVSKDELEAMTRKK